MLISHGQNLARAECAWCLRRAATCQFVLRWRGGHPRRKSKIGLEDAQCMGGRRSLFTVLPPSLGVTPSRGGVVKNVRAGKTDSLNCMCSPLSRIRNMFQWLGMFGAHAKP